MFAYIASYAPAGETCTSKPLPLRLAAVSFGTPRIRRDLAALEREPPSVGVGQELELDLVEDRRGVPVRGVAVDDDLLLALVGCRA